MEQNERFKETFFHECDELLGKLERDLAAIAHGQGGTDTIQSAFREIHSIKGGAGMFGFTRLIAFSHAYEGAFEAILKGRVQVTPALIQRLLSAADILADLVHAARTGEHQAQGFESTIADFLQGLAAHDPEPRGEDQANAPAARAHAGTAGGKTVYAITLAPLPGMFRRAIEPLGIMRALKELGELEITADTSALPEFAAVEPVTPYFTWSMRLTTDAPETVIRTVFDFAAGSCQFEIACETAPATQADAAPGECAHDSAQVAENKAWSRASLPFDSERRISSIRVDLERVDRLVNLVGEIAIAQAMVLQQIDQALVDSNSHLAQVLNQLVQHTRNLQDSVMAIRAQPVRTIFGRIPRVVREVSALLGKKVTLATAGEETEIDKTIIEALSDPLLHIIRNCIDHGIETPEERVAAGKPVHGTICLSASQQGSRIVIQVSDDGRGINREKLRAKAIERGIIARDDNLTGAEIDALVFSPGISTADTVTDISGRGIGMDIVMSAVQKIGGRVSISSLPGKGTATQLTLPLTLAVLEGMVVRAGSESYVVPLSNVRECLLAETRSIHAIPGIGYTVNIRGTETPLISLAGALDGVPQALGCLTQILVTETEGGHLAGLAVDEIIGQQQVVVKSVRENYADVSGIAGATILGDGHVALILDVDQIRVLSTAHESISSIAAPEIPATGALAA